MDRHLETMREQATQKGLSVADKPTSDTSNHSPELAMEAAVAASKMEIAAKGVAAGFNEAHVWSLFAVMEIQVKARSRGACSL